MRTPGLLRAGWTRKCPITPGGICRAARMAFRPTGLHSRPKAGCPREGDHPGAPVWPVTGLVRDRLFPAAWPRRTAGAAGPPNRR